MIGWRHYHLKWLHPFVVTSILSLSPLLPSSSPSSVHLLPLLLFLPLSFPSSSSLFLHLLSSSFTLFPPSILLSFTHIFLYILSPFSVSFRYFLYPSFILLSFLRLSLPATFFLFHIFLCLLHFSLTHPKKSSSLSTHHPSFHLLPVFHSPS